MAKFAITTFFSYKGGAGRSTTCLNTLPFIAEQCEASPISPLLLLDTDVESAGMTYLLDSADFFHDKFDVKSLLLGEEQWSVGAVGESIKEHPLYKHFLPVGHKLGLKDDDAVMFLGVNDKSMVDRSMIDGRIAVTINNFRKFCKYNNVCGAVMDSAAGDQITANLSVDCANNLVCCMRPTNQFRVGTFNYLNRMDIRLADQSAPRVILLPTVVPKDCVIDGVQQLDAAYNNTQAFLPTIENLEITKAFTKKEMYGINEVTRFKWREAVLYKIREERPDELTDDEKQALGRYEELAKTIVWDD